MPTSDTSETIDEIIASSPSLLIREVARLTERQRRLIGVTNVQLAGGSVLFETFMQMLDDDDTRPMIDRLDDLEAVVARFDQLGIEEMLQTWTLNADEPQLPRWMKRATAPNFKRFLRRFIGAGPYDRLQAAARTDGAVVFVAARRSLRYLLPLATAFDHIVGSLSPEQVEQIEGLQPVAGSSLLEMAVKCDSKLNGLLDVGLVAVPDVARPDELFDLPGSLGDLTEQLCGKISDKSADLIEQLSESLSRKVKGAHDALRFSADPVSQAANSLIELIDRLLRQAFADDEVLAWLDEWYPDDLHELTHVQHGQRRPTKRGQALCFVAAGGDVPEQALIQEVAAASLVAVRNSLQQLKHADQGTDAERAAVVSYLVTIESTLLLVCNLAWLGAGEESLAKLRSRLAAA